MAKTTLKTRKQQFKRYRKFCDSYNLMPYPCSASQASLYATYLSDKMKPVSVRSYLSAVWFFQKLEAQPDFSSNYLFKKTLDGIERLYNVEPVSKYPLSTVDLMNIYALLDMSIEIDRIFWCSIVVAFRAVLRICHVVESIHSIKVKDIDICEKYVKIHISSSKTDQYGRHPYDIYLHRSDGSPLCPALLLADLITGASKNSKVFMVHNGSKKMTQKYSYVNSKIKSLSITLGLPVHNISTHSLRHGGATFLKNLGMSVPDIMRRSNWRSNAVYKYLHDSSQELLNLDNLPNNYLSNLL